MESPRYYGDVRHIVTTSDENKANELLQNSAYELLKIENLVSPDLQTKVAASKIVYILGRMAATQNNTHATQASPKPPITKTPSVPLQLLAALPW
ncbi:MAG: hypothetical protein JRN52_14140, partial [Nitrososphaerota archaeon]|nr:hypothetical protein [Nitrososphaerota archaeon]